MPHLAHYLGLLHKAQGNLAAAFREVAEGHRDEADVFHICQTLARECDRHAEELEPFVDRYGEAAPDEPDRLHSEIFHGARFGGLGLLRDLQDLYLMAAECDIAWTLVGQAAQGLRDDGLLAVVRTNEKETAVQLKWLRTRMKQAAPQALVVA
jgi:hypothetical protein